MDTDQIIGLVVVAALAGFGYLMYTERPWESPCQRLERLCQVAEAQGHAKAMEICGQWQQEKQSSDVLDDGCGAYNDQIAGVGGPG